MDQEELVEKFLKLPLYGKIQVYRTLRPSRRIVLRKGYDRFKREKQQDKQREIKKESKAAQLQMIKNILSPLDFDFNDIKIDDELKLVYAIIIKDGHIQYHDPYDSNTDKEEDSFYTAKQKMIGLIERNRFRDDQQGNIDKNSTYYDDLFYFLDALKYAPDHKIKDMLLPMQDHWVKMYKHIGTPDTRSKRIVKAISNWIKDIHQAGEYDSNYREWQKGIDDSFHWESLDIYNRADIATQDIE